MHGTLHRCWFFEETFHLVPDFIPMVGSSGPPATLPSQNLQQASFEFRRLYLDCTWPVGPLGKGWKSD